MNHLAPIQRYLAVHPISAPELCYTEDCSESHLDWAGSVVAPFAEANICVMSDTPHRYIYTYRQPSGKYLSGAADVAGGLERVLVDYLIKYFGRGL